MNAFKKKLAQTQINKAKTALAVNNYKLAHDHSLRAVQLAPDNTEALLILAATSNPEDSIKYLQKVLEKNPNNHRAKEGLIWAEEQILKSGQVSIASNFSNKKPSPSHSANGKPLYPSLNTHNQVIAKDKSSKKKSLFIYKAFSRWQSWLAFSCILFLILVAIFAPILAPVDEELGGSPYYKIVCDRYLCQAEPPSSESILGTIKEFDVYHTLIWGTRQALIFGIGAAISTAFIGTMLGSISAYVGGWFDRIIMRICDAFLAFPIIAAVALFAQVIALLSQDSWGLSMVQFDAIPEKLTFFQSLIFNTDPILLALIMFSWMPYTRIIHAQVLQVKKTDYVEAAHTVGAKHSRIIFRHILPNSLSPAIITATRDIGRMVVAQASFTFIGVGSSSAWALLLNIGKDWIIGPGGNLFTRWWIYLPITIAVVFFGFSWNLLGDEINIWMNPKNT